MELRGREMGEFAIVRKGNHIHPIELKVMTPRSGAWMDNVGVQN